MTPDTNTVTPNLHNQASESETPQPPLARREPVEHTLHGDRRVDHYAWMREKENPEVIAYLKSENSYTDAAMRSTEVFQEKLYQEMLGRILQTDLSVPYLLRGYLYFTRTEEGKQYPLHCRSREPVGTLGCFVFDGCHMLGDSEPDTMLFEEKDERFRLEVERTRSTVYILLLSASLTTSEVRFLAADQPAGEFKIITPRTDEHEYYVDHHPGASAEATGGIFYIRTNSGGRTFCLVTAKVSDPGRDKWQDFIPHRAQVMLAGADVFESHLILSEREDGLPYLRVVNLPIVDQDALAASHRIEFNEPAYNASLGTNPEFAAQHVRFHYESLITSRSVFDYDIRTRERILRKQQPVLGGYDATQYVSERLHATAQDGTRVPISIVYRRDTPRNASAPLLLYGYGSYGIAVPVSFSSNRLSLLDRGVTYAIAHIRGGGELGKPWHDAGRLHQKRNTFTDFIVAAEHLIAQRYTSPQKLIIEGGSAGGLLMGAVTNLRPGLFRIVISHVPFVDVLNTMLDASLPLTIGEYEEWGNPQIPKDYACMKTYCPYTSLERKAYPTLLVKTGLNDSQVMYWEPAKYVAKLRTLKTDANPLLFKVNMGAGHGGSSGRYDYLREIAFDYAFLLKQLGIPE